jgi:hypothetical protein
MTQKPEQLKLPAELLPVYAEPFKSTERIVTRRGKHIKVQTLDTGPDVPARRKPHIHKRFTQFPGIWEEVLSKARVSNSTIWVAHVLIYEAWRSGKSTVKLSSELLRRVHVGRDGKREALRKLAELHLITTSGANGRNPIVTVHFAD